jgi:anti-anti-sigma regulatory factor
MDISGEQTLRECGDLREQLLDAVIPGVALELDLAGVTAADLAFVQVIEAARRQAAAGGGCLRLLAVSDAVRGVLDRAGIADPFWPETLQ